MDRPDPTSQRWPRRSAAVIASALARAITLVESTRADHREQAQQLLLELMPRRGQALHVGITGVPGVGKSTTIEALGMYLIEQGHRVAVLAVDPSSTRTGGSILGDKTRMARLAVHPDAYIRPSPTSGTLGGVAKATRETIVLLEAAGFDVDPGRDGRRRAVRGGGGQHGRHLRVPDPGPHRRPAAGHQEGRARARRHRRGQQGRRRARHRGQGRGARARRRDPADLSARNPLAPTGSDDERAGGHRSGASCGTPCSSTARCSTEAGEFDARRRAQQVDWTWSMVRDAVLDRVLDHPGGARASGPRSNGRCATAS